MHCTLDATDEEWSLEDVIDKRLVTSEFSGHRFLPEDAFGEVIIKGNVEQELKNLEPNAHNDAGCTTVQYIMRHARKTFAILVLCNLVNHATTLETYGFKDDYLPIEQADNRQVRSLSGYPVDDRALGWFGSWKKLASRVPRLQIAKFCENQWTVLCHVFSATNTIEELRKACVLPLTTYKTRGGGGHSTLHKASIHHAHQSIIQGDQVAIKELRTNTEETCDLEVDALKLARKLNHTHIVKFVAAFQQNSVYYLMFQWVDGGNLREFWESHGWSRNQEIIEWSLGQIKGLADALNEWHNQFKEDENKNCLHGDIKPENIVRSTQPDSLGILQLADMGLARIHNLPTNLRQTESGALSGTLRYQSPEIKTTISGKVSRSYDMWGMGCILLEFIVWLLYGSDGLRKFNNSFTESFFIIQDPRGVQLQPSVRRWIDHIRNNLLTDGEPCVSLALRGLLDFVDHRLLVEDASISEGAQGPIENGSQFDAINITAPQDDSPTLPVRQRAKSHELCDALVKILSDSEPADYYDSGAESTLDGSRKRPPPERRLTGSNTLKPPSEIRRTSGSTSTATTGTVMPADTMHPYATPSTLDIWNFHSDNQFAKGVFSCLKNPNSGLLSKDFVIRFADVEKARINCRLCHILFSKIDGTLITSGATSFHRKGNVLIADVVGSTSAILSLVTTPDSLCIVQDDPNDLRTEVHTMENVFSFAYVTLSATSARDTVDGFIKSRTQRQSYSVDILSPSGGDASKVYLCEPIDDFRRDVEHSELSRRGWVFQERALSRRTIHFTETQVYWECGKGIRCETLTKLANPKSMFLSDPNFPSSMEKHYKGMRILFFQNVYETYAQLQFTYERDRAVGMAGIETRLARVYKARAKFGILDHSQEPSYLRRSLLWQNVDNGAPLELIDYPKDTVVPTWSWMAVMGPIKYVDIAFDTVEWSNDLQSYSGSASHTQGRPEQYLEALWAISRPFETETEDIVRFDRSDHRLDTNMHCVVLGTEKAESSEVPEKHYGLLVESDNERNTYRRIGVATFMREQAWKTKQVGTEIYIV
ncbi:hypothetical protein SLS59_001546 [Nothophoma quercina]|uniref:Protein kinase domain-containing protein n=1 Tax=Nothophoma quercina TaxID=749835 RepID=A0ABR3RXP3_9PLEO